MVKTIILTLFLALINVAQACDVCSAATMNASNGLMLRKNTSYLNFTYQGLGLETESDLFLKSRTLVLNGAYAIKKWQLYASLPVLFQNIESKELNGRNRGLGDLVLGVNYNLINKTGWTNNSLFLGSGVKLPTGKKNSVLLAAPIGTGSVDFTAQLQYVLSAKIWSLNSRVSGKFNTTNKENYRYGSQYSFQSIFSVKQEKDRWSFLPLIGASIEYLMKDRSNGFKRNNTGGIGAFGEVGLQVNFSDNYSGTLLSSIPVYQNFRSQEGLINQGARFKIQLNYIFNNKK